ncbi:hypothetical protein CVT24_012148 [Panaeolus cyanescens]|uniref:F-box domain-containing protein n=1 Tax=Panaeolus cyanescens TaxID=181874 RepID=A0A409X308_9AGAR|nr:hypothetical protein CVT24_012148 [Panaeolus cyanescens]
MVQLPQELLDIIIDHLARDEFDASTIASLKACSLSSKTLRRRSRGHLFSHVALKYNTHHLSPASEFRRLSAFKALLDGDRDLVHCIKSLELWVDEFTLIGRQRTPLPDIFTILYSTPLTSLDTLTLRGSQYRPLPWDIIPDYMQAALYNLFQSGSLEKVEIHHINNIPLHILCTAHPALRSLSIVDATFDELTTHPELHVGSYSSCNGPHLALNALSVDRSFHRLLPVIERSPEGFGSSVSSLKEFRIVIDHEDRHHLPLNFLSTLQHLSCLTIFSYSYLGSEDFELDLGALPTVSSLCLHFEVSTIRYAALALNNAFAILLQNGPNQVENVAIKLDLPISILDNWDMDGSVILSVTQKIAWSLLDASFADERYPKLRRCDVSIKWVPMGVGSKLEGGGRDDARCTWLQRFFSPPPHIHHAVRVSVALEHS